MTKITNIVVSNPNASKPPSDMTLTVTCDIDTVDGTTPKVFFPAQGMGTKMTHTTGTTWSASNKQMYAVGSFNGSVACNGVTTPYTFSLAKDGTITNGNT